jgi:hypothetical protein
MPYPDSEYPSITRGKDKRESQRLMAAAPELLEALQSLIDLSDDGFLHIEGSIATEDPVITAARAAIAKAEGRE